MYDRALPQVFGYLRARAGSEAVAEDLTAETFLAAVQAIERDTVPQLTVAWLIGVARHKLVDHWRRQAREARGLQPASRRTTTSPTASTSGSNGRARTRCSTSSGRTTAPRSRFATSTAFRFPRSPHHLDRTVHATEALLVRARNAFRVAYARGECDAD